MAKARRRRNSFLESLENRWLMAAQLVGTGLPNLSVSVNTDANPVSTYIPLTNFISNTAQDPSAHEVVRFETNVGSFDMTMREDAAPLTVANFLNYVNSGAYNNTIIHRSVPGFVVQGGGYALPNLSTHIPENAPVQNEFDLSNVRGTVAMAKLGTDPNSATSEWFVNLADNSSNLDNQNGGFTVFATVSDMTTPDAIAALPTFSVNGTNFSDLPLTNYSGSASNPVPIQTSNLVTVSNASVINGLTYSLVSNSNPNLVTASVVDGSLVLNYAKNTTGNASITIEGVGSNGDPGVTSTFEVTVGSPGDVKIGTGQSAKSVTFIDSDGTKATVAMKGAGTASMHFSGDNILSTTNKGVITVTGTGLSLDDIALNSTNAGSSITFSAKGGTDGAITIHNMTSDAAMGTVSAKSVNLVGTMDLFGGAVKEIDLKSASNATIGAGSSGTALTLKIGSATDTAVSAGSGIKSLTSGSWTTSSGNSETITATGIGSLTVKGDFSPTLDVTGGNILTAKISGTMSGSIAAANIKTMQVGTLSNSEMEIANVLVSLKAGTITGSFINSTGSIGTISATTITGTKIFAGAGSTLTGTAAASTLPTAKSDFASNQSMKSVTSKFFSNSDIIASHLGKVSLGSVTTSNGGTEFGLGAEIIDSLSFAPPSSKALKYSKLTDPTKAPTPSGDFHVVLV